MSSRFARVIRSILPFRGGGDEIMGALRALRLALVSVAILTPVYWIVYQQTSPEAFDPLWGRAMIVGLALGLLALTYVWGPVQRHPRAVLIAFVYAMLVWFGVLAWANDLSADYGLGYAFVVVAAAMVFSLAWSSPRPLATMLLAALTIASVVAVCSDASVGGVSPSVFLLVMGSGAFIVYLTFIGRLQAVRDLKRSEARSGDAERLAGTGYMTFDLETGQRIWSGGAHRIFGIPPSEAPLPSIVDLVHPDDFEEARRNTERVLQEGHASDRRFRIVRPDGEVRTLRAVVTISQDQDGRPSQLQGVFLDVTDQVAYEAALETERDRAAAAAEAKTAFLANMSHEIRTPLTAIIGFAQLLGEETGTEYADLVEPIETGGRRLLSTLNSVLDLARMEAGETDLNLVATDVTVHAREVAGMLRSQAEANGLTLVVDAAGPLAVLADPDALSRVLTNLVSNAVKFTERGGITLAIRRAGDWVEVAVDDTGRGMDAAFLAELFEPFRQASTGWARSHEGTGLGLTITRELVHAMDGSIEVTSELGVGSRFLVSLPAADEVPEARVSERAPALA